MSKGKCQRKTAKLVEGWECGGLWEYLDGLRKHVRSPFRYTGSQGSPRTWEMCVCVCLGWRKDEGCRAGHRGVGNELGGEQSMAMWTSHPNFTLPEPNCEGGKWKDYFFLIIKVELIYNVVSISAVYQSDSVTHIPEYTYILSGKESTCYARTAGNTGLIPWWGIFPGGGHGNPLQYSRLESLIDRGASRARVAKSQTRLTWLNTHTCSFSYFL